MYVRIYVCTYGCMHVHAKPHVDGQNFPCNGFPLHDLKVKSPGALNVSKITGSKFSGEITNSYCCISAAFLRKLTAEKHGYFM